MPACDIVPGRKTPIESGRDRLYWNPPREAAGDGLRVPIKTYDGTVPVTVDVDDMRRVRIDWDEAETYEQTTQNVPPTYYDDDLPDDDLLGGEPDQGGVTVALAADDRAGAQHLVAAALVLRRGRVALHQLTNRVLELGMVVGDGDVAQPARPADPADRPYPVHTGDTSSP